MPNNNLNDLSTQQKVESVVEDYDDIAREYAEKFYEDTSDDKYIDRKVINAFNKRMSENNLRQGEFYKS